MFFKKKKQLLDEFTSSEELWPDEDRIILFSLEEYERFELAALAAEPFLKETSSGYWRDLHDHVVNWVYLEDFISKKNLLKLMPNKIKIGKEDTYPPNEICMVETNKDFYFAKYRSQDTWKIELTESRKKDPVRKKEPDYLPVQQGDRWVVVSDLIEDLVSLL